jgi:hypothetical protein
VSSNDLNAYAALPQVSYQLSGTGLTAPTLLATYQIPAAAAYDWSAFPAALVSISAATWREPLVKGNTPGRVAAGINYAAQSRTHYLTFLSALVLGIAGGAIVAAIQEALHVALD